MHKLTVSEIEAIDASLEYAGVEYLDIRYEMTDHVAAAIEATPGDSFGQAFDDYMQLHRNELLRNYKKFRRIALRRALNSWVKTLLQPWAVLAAAAIVYLSFYFDAVIGTDEMADNLHLVFFGAFGFAMLPGIISQLVYKARYSATTLLMSVPGVALLVIQPIAMERRTDNLWAIYIYYAVLIVMGLGIGIAGFSFNKKYRLRYDG